jgi:hypothetical protein
MVLFLIDNWVVGRRTAGRKTVGRKTVGRKTVGRKTGNPLLQTPQLLRGTTFKSSTQRVGLTVTRL